MDMGAQQAGQAEQDPPPRNSVFCIATDGSVCRLWIVEEDDLPPVGPPKEMQIGDALRYVLDAHQHGERGDPFMAGLNGDKPEPGPQPTTTGMMRG